MIFKLRFEGWYGVIEESILGRRKSMREVLEVRESKMNLWIVNSLG